MHFSSQPPPPHTGWRARLSYHVFKTLATLRIGEMFDIIVDFEVPEDEPSAQPASQPAVDDLREWWVRLGEQPLQVLL